MIVSSISRLPHYRFIFSKFKRLFQCVHSDILFRKYCSILLTIHDRICIHYQMYVWTVNVLPEVGFYKELFYKSLTLFDPNFSTTFIKIFDTKNSLYTFKTLELYLNPNSIWWTTRFIRFVYTASHRRKNRGIKKSYFNIYVIWNVILWS